MRVITTRVGNGNDNNALETHANCVSNIKQQFKKVKISPKKCSLIVCASEVGVSRRIPKYRESFNDILQCNTLLICYFFTERINLKPIINEFCNQNMIIVD